MDESLNAALAISAAEAAREGDNEVPLDEALHSSLASNAAEAAALGFDLNGIRTSSSDSKTRAHKTRTAIENLTNFVGCSSEMACVALAEHGGDVDAAAQVLLLQLAGKRLTECDGSNSSRFKRLRKCD